MHINHAHGGQQRKHIADIPAAAAAAAAAAASSRTTQQQHIHSSSGRAAAGAAAAVAHHARPRLPLAYQSGQGIAVALEKDITI